MNKARSACVAMMVLLLASACSTSPPPRVTVRPAIPACPDCGRVVKLEAVDAVRATPQGGAVLDGVVGGVISKPSTSASSRADAGPTFRLVIQMDDGRRMVVHQASVSPRLSVGSRVKLASGRVVLLR